MTKAKYGRLAVYFLAFVLPALSMLNCSVRYNGSSMYTKDCTVELSILMEVAEITGAVVMFSSYLAFIPILIYCFCVIIPTELIVKFIEKRKKRSNDLDWFG
ncbi:hypothetical protein A9Q74_16245 [Colwellia sp. 39_35_sub15_T18]|nr:hypothetical protein A9Q74_16245 [Colwellia sp. 39_35_sub15_T18]